MKRNPYRILVVDDERDICRALEFLLSREGYAVETALSGEDALEKLKKTGYDLLLTDLRMEGMDGIELLERAKSLSPSIIVIIMTAYASIESAVEAMKKGASDYIVKPFLNEDVKLTIKRLLDHRSLQLENQALRQQLSQHFGCKDFIGESPQIKRIFETLERIIPTKSNILILGESGTGKGMIAEIIHRNSPRRDKPFMSINCSAIPENLLESELFGYRKGAFTGASTDKTGLISLADGGTLFLDEIGDMPIGLQSKLLKVIEVGEVFPLGDTKPKMVDIRIIAATNRNLEEMIEKKEFREDLYYRLNVIEIMLPPLRERREDIPLLVRHFIEICNRENNKNIKGVDDEAMKVLMDYQWYGNARELRNVIERAVVLCESEVITTKDLPGKIKKKEVFQGHNLRDELNYFERKLLLDRLSQHKWNKEETARELGIDLATLYRKMKRLDIETGRRGH
ncbi:transcriptional regulatory protein ZraR [bacterium BMS3Bbin06]|nr:transcriptional regulatory protein ZraR [bacterium BMS3Abin08]GBE35552.1 transcriptional regulatory protein ZraR [bacterium BMS3Bbin06]HDH00886.1 sigma-54-dependent Fis family transcriptional regulator [Nitrospirota bacterium]HDO34942.1 sigma-54-dependent Fis family transcriptional regulator [Nitrospirota bacterium]HDY70448.1 sigma-54-dependent Fis family transcriptional regulator [Nitrospirota bacterium]